MSSQAQLMELYQLKQRLEETLRQRERELTALKGALKEEVATHDKELEALREQYSADMVKLRSSMDQVSQVGNVQSSQLNELHMKRAKQACSNGCMLLRFSQSSGNIVYFAGKEPI